MKAKTGWITIILLTLVYAYLLVWSVLKGFVIGVMILTVFYIWLIRSTYKRVKESN